MVLAWELIKQEELMSKKLEFVDILLESIHNDRQFYVDQLKATTDAIKKAESDIFNLRKKIEQLNGAVFALDQALNQATQKHQKLIEGFKPKQEAKQEEVVEEIKQLEVNEVSAPDISIEEDVSSRLKKALKSKNK